MNLLSNATLSSLAAQSHSLAVSASNVANVRSLGLPLDGSQPRGDEFVPQRTLQTSGPGGIVRSQAVPVDPPSVPVFDPNNPRADANGLVPIANVSLEQEFVVQIQAKLAYKANLAALETQNEVLGELLDVVS